MPLPTSGNTGIDILVNKYNTREATKAPTKELLRLLDDIEGQASLQLAGRPALTFLNAVQRERSGLSSSSTSTGNTPTSNAPPVTPSQTPPPVTWKKSTPPTTQRTLGSNAPLTSKPTPTLSSTSPSPVIPSMENPGPSSGQPTFQVQFIRKGLREKQEKKMQNTVELASTNYQRFAASFTKGADLLYGLSKPRGDYLLALDPHYTDRAVADPEHLRLQPPEKMDFIIVDTYNNAFLGTEVLTGMNALLTNNKGERMLDSKQIADSQNYLGKLEGEHEEVGRFREFLEKNTSYDLQSICSDSRGDMVMRYGRSCKAGLAYAATVRKGKVHFVLDGIDFKRILEDLDKPRNEREITGKELRWLFRHRDDSQIKNEVLFWENGVPAKPPWERPEYASAWEAYDKKTKEKHSKDPKPVKAFTPR